MDKSQLMELLREAGATRRVLSELKVPKSIDMRNLELLPIPTKSDKIGILLLNINKLHALPYEMTPRKAASSGSLKPIICDFCYTWTSGSGIAMITFMRNVTGAHSFSFYCCSKLNCSANVRGMTREAIISRAHLQESISEEDRVIRLRDKLLRIYAIVSANNSAK